jgi:hypothetical protein
MLPTRDSADDTIELLRCPPARLVKVKLCGTAVVVAPVTAALMLLLVVVLVAHVDAVGLRRTLSEEFKYCL